MNSSSISSVMDQHNLDADLHLNLEHEFPKGRARYKVITRNATIDLDDKEMGEMHPRGKNVEFNPPIQSGVTSNVQDATNLSKTKNTTSDFTKELQDPAIVYSASSTHKKMAADSAQMHTALARRAMFADSSSSSFCSSSLSNSHNVEIASILNNRTKISTVSSFSSSADNESPSPNFTKRWFSKEKAVDDNDVFEELQPLQKTTIFGQNGVLQVKGNSDDLPHHNAEKDIILSAKGQIARQSYQSSGYGTGSGSKGSGQELSTTRSSYPMSEDDAVFTEGLPSEQLNLVQQNQTCDVCEKTFKSITSGRNDFNIKTLQPEENQSRIILSIPETRARKPVETHYSQPAGDKKIQFNIASQGARKEGSEQRQLNNDSTLNSYKFKPDGDFNISSQKQKDSGCLNGETHTDVGFSEPCHDTTLSGQKYTPQTNIKQKFPHSLGSTRQSLQIPFSFLQPSLTNMATQSQTSLSSSSSGSFFITPSMEATLPLSYNGIPPSIQRKMLESVESASVDASTGSSYNLDSLLKPEVDRAHKRLLLKTVAPKVFQAHEETSQVLIEILQAPSETSQVSVSLDNLNLRINTEFLDKLLCSARCEDFFCSNDDCLQIKNSLAVLQDHKIPVQDLTNFHKTLLIHMFEHSEICLLPNCPFPWCSCEQMFTRRPQSVDDIIIGMKQRAENFLDERRLFNSPVEHVFKVDETLDIEPVPGKETNWQLLCMMGNSSKAVLAMPLWNNPMKSQYWVVKKVLTAEGDCQWKLFSKLRSLKHESVNKLLWVASLKDKDSMLVCSLYEGYSLHECLQYVPQDSWPDLADLKLIISIMLQIISAVQHLHELDIVYLNWISKNVLVTQACDQGVRVKLCNFSSSALLDNYDSGHLSLVLPVHVLTPELLQDKGDDLQPESDVWGLACLLHELATGRPIWHEQRHLKAEDLKKEMEKQPVPKIPTTHSELEPIFAACWKVKPKNRMSVNEMIDVLQSSNKEINFRKIFTKDYPRSEA